MGQVLSVSELEKTYEVRKTAFSARKTLIKAVDKVSFDLDRGKTLGIVGESGSGKSTLARCLLLLERPDRGTVKFDGQDLTAMSEKKLRDVRRKIQVIFQDPYSSLNPRKRIFDTIAEPILFHGIATKDGLREKVMDIFQGVGLDEDFLDKYPHEMSGGQRQRVAIGRALATNPSLLVADEPVSSLDVSIQAQIVNLFIDIRERSEISMIFVSHDLNIVRFISDDIMVMYRGRVVEKGTKDEVFSRPLHPYTRMLIAASQGTFQAVKDEGRALADASCDYYSRCEKREPRCTQGVPELVGTGDHKTACFMERA
ncbi:MAG: Oligopeptide transport ATP-binding protein OppF [Syntrophorhabdus sp. PtaU1.Bin002]|nr:MAG: Oligopeptide transport ATP-binding protein OppF [Syntrophorhabdus sp. PtaB.Bin006]OPY72682.1 MAG: Oligopeptide transport ATP-binding protein OppF [Syntrophorhabdus sp. PtaU1.Bin002]